MGGIGIPELLVILVIVVLLFGTKKLKGLGGDLGGAIKSFRSAMREADADESKTPKAVEKPDNGQTYDGEVVSKTENDKV